MKPGEQKEKCNGRGTALTRREEKADTESGIWGCRGKWSGYIQADKIMGTC